MSADRIRNGTGQSGRTGEISPGDLVVVNEHYIDETFYSALKNFVGIVVRFITEHENPAAIEVFWSDGAMEIMYEDEIDAA